MRALARHACDKHEWDDGRCDFHPLGLFCCNECDDGDDLKCEGKDYHTRCALTCPLDSLSYEIECHERANISDQLVHPILKRGHPNWFSKGHSPSPDCWCFEDDIIAGDICTCRAHG